jgi:hypothetical protein
MSDEKPDPIEDVRKGLGLLFRAARTAVEKLPTKDVEQAVVSTAREVGRAVETVARTVEREVFGKKEPWKAEWPSEHKGEEPKAKEEPPNPDDTKPPEPPQAA